MNILCKKQYLINCERLGITPTLKGLIDYSNKYKRVFRVI